VFTDSHAHLDDVRFSEDRDQVLRRAWDAGVRTILTIGNGSTPDQMGCGIPLTEEHDWIYTSVGVHPHDAAKTENRHYDMMEELAKNPRVIAIGETGLDYYYDKPTPTLKSFFRSSCLSVA
jgi:TatD DNase family protein